MLTQAIKEAYASAPTAEVILHTLELNHASFTQPIRVVRNTVDLLACLEAGAPHDAGAWVNFVAFAFDFVPPGSTTQAAPEITIAVDNVSQEIGAALELAIESMTPITVIYRPYLASNPAQPEMNPPLIMTVLSGTINALQVSLRAGFADFANRKFPSEMYTATRFPGLVR